MLKRSVRINGLILAVLVGVFASADLTFAASDIIKLRMQTHSPPEQMHRSYDPFVKAVSDMSGGKIQITLYPVGGLVPFKQAMESVGNRVVEIATAPEGFMHKSVPVSVFGQGLPFAFKDRGEAHYFMWHMGFIELLQKGYEKKNIHVIPIESYNTGLMTKTPIEKAEDLQGMKLRAFGTMQKWLTEMGASTVYISGAELYTSLSTGVVEGAHWGDAFQMSEMKFHEVLKNYMVPTPLVGSWNSLWFNLDVWNSFTKEQQAIFENAVIAQGSFWGGTESRVLRDLALKNMKNDWGVSVNVVPEEQQEKMRKAAVKVWEEIAQDKDPLCREAIDLLYKFLDEMGRPVQ